MHVLELFSTIKDLVPFFLFLFIYFFIQKEKSSIRLMLFTATHNSVLFYYIIVYNEINIFDLNKIMSNRSLFYYFVVPPSLSLTPFLKNNKSNSCLLFSVLSAFFSQQFSLSLLDLIKFIQINYVKEIQKKEAGPVGAIEGKSKISRQINNLLYLRV